MLSTYLNNIPYSKFVLIEDNLEQPAKKLLKYIVNSHTMIPECNIEYYVFEGVFVKVKKMFSHPRVKYHDFVSDSSGWLNTNKKDFSEIALQHNETGCVIVINSLSHAIFQFGIATVYQTLQQLLSTKGVVRIVAVYHQDVCENQIETARYFQHLSTFTITLEPKFKSKTERVSYIYRKPGGKIIKKIEEYWFEQGILKSEPVKKFDSKTLVQEHLAAILPENLSTFKISLSEKEKESRDKVVLPYLPKDSTSSLADEQKEAKIFYQFDDIDDWDEEDPDDDLDI